MRFSTDGTKIAAGSHSCVKVFDVSTFRQLYMCRKVSLQGGWGGVRHVENDAPSHPLLALRQTWYIQRAELVTHVELFLGGFESVSISCMCIDGDAILVQDFEAAFVHLTR